MKKEKENLEKKQVLEAVVKQINKTFGDGAIMKMSEDSIQNIDSCSTGSLLLDIALGVGGLPYGRIVEIFGPESSGKTTLTLETISEAQKNNKICAFIDAENAFDPIYAKDLGVDVEKLIVSQPDNGEQALDIVETLINSGAVDVIVVDSVAALVPRAEIEGEMGDTHVGLQARLMSKGLRKITGAAKKNNVLLIFINQIRMKIGVLFGCLSGSTKIPFVDGRYFTIKEIVENKIQGKVFSMNEKTGLIEAKEIIDWHHNGFVDKPEDYLLIESVVKSYNYYSRAFLTHNHNVSVLNKKNKIEWKESKDLKIGDKLVSISKNIINHDLEDFVIGCLLGGDVIKYNKVYKNHDLKVFNYDENKDFLNWKIKHLELLNMKQKKTGHYLSNLKGLNNLSKLNHFNNKNPLLFFKKNKIKDFTLYLWFKGNGYINEYGEYIFPTKLNMLKDLKKMSFILNKNGFENDIVQLYNNKFNYAFSIKGEKIKNIIDKYDLEVSSGVIENQLYCKEELKQNISTITKIDFMKQKLFDLDSGKYDITVADNHNYLAGGKDNGFIVHNSPETTTGGNALKFYASVRLDIRKTSTIKSGEDSIGNEVKIKVVKNKVAPPFQEANTEIIFGKGFNFEGEVLKLGVDLGLFEKAGAWYKYNGNNFAQGQLKAIEWLKNNPDVLNMVHNLIIEKKLNKV